MFRRLVLDNSSTQSKAFVQHLTVSSSNNVLEKFWPAQIYNLFSNSKITFSFKGVFQEHFPKKLLSQYFTPCEIGFAQPKSLGVATPIVHNCDPLDGQAAYAPLRLHSNWTVTMGMEFKVGELTLDEYIHLLSKSLT